MKKIIIKTGILLICLMAAKPAGVFGQLPVTDVAAAGQRTAESIMESSRFLLSIEQAINSTSSLLNIVETGGKTVKALQTANEYLEKVSGYVDMVQDIYTMAEVSKNIIDRAMLSQKILKEQTNVLDQMSTVSDCLDYYTYLLQTITRLTEKVVKLYKTADTELQKARAIRELRRSAEHCQSIGDRYCMSLLEQLEEDNIKRQQRILWRAAKALGATDYAGMRVAQITDPRGTNLGNAKSSIAEFVYAVERTSVPNVSFEDTKEITTVATESEAKKLDKGLRAPLGTFFYAVSALMLFFGAFKVYSRVMQGEDLYKAASVWLLGAILASILGMLLQVWDKFAVLGK